MLMTKNIRIPSCPRVHDVDPFADMPDSPDIQLRQISAEHTGNGLSRAAVDLESQAVPNGLTRIARRAALANFVNSGKVVDAALRYESTLESLTQK